MKIFHNHICAFIYTTQVHYYTYISYQIECIYKVTLRLIAYNLLIELYFSLLIDYYYYIQENKHLKKKSYFSHSIHCTHITNR